MTSKRTPWERLLIIFSVVLMLMISINTKTNDSVPATATNPGVSETLPQTSKVVTLEERLQTAMLYKKPLTIISEPSELEVSESNEATTETVEESNQEVVSPTESITDVPEKEVEFTEETTSYAEEPSKSKNENLTINSTADEPVKNEPSKWQGEVLNKRNGVVQGPSGKETYYNLPMGGVIRIMRKLGYDYEYWVRDDGVKMFGPYVMCAANLEIRPKGTILETSLGTAIVCDTGSFAQKNRTQLDIAVAW